MTTPEVIVFPDAEIVFADYLNDTLPMHSWDVTATPRVPIPRPARFVRVLRTGGVRRNLVVDAAQLTFEAWCDLESDAATLIQLVRGLVNCSAGQVLGAVMVYKVEEAAGPQNLPDPASAQCRYTFTSTVHLRGDPI